MVRVAREDCSAREFASDRGVSTSPVDGDIDCIRFDISSLIFFSLRNKMVDCNTRWNFDEQVRERVPTSSSTVAA